MEAAKSSTDAHGCEAPVAGGPFPGIAEVSLGVAGPGRAPDQ